MLKKFLKQNTGSTLIEVLVAIVIVGLVLTAIAATLTNTVSNSSQADYRQMASRYAQEAIEVFRQERSTRGWSGFTSYLSDGSWCVLSSGSLKKDCSASEKKITLTNPNATFSRVIQVDEDPNTDPTKVTITATVSWDDGGAVRDVVVEQAFYDY